MDATFDRERRTGGFRHGQQERRLEGARAVDGRAVMSKREAFDSILASLHDAALDHGSWSRATALIDDTLGTYGSSLVFGDGNSKEDVQIYRTWSYFRGERLSELEHEYFEDYYALDERVPRLRTLPDSQLFHMPDLYSREELKTSAAYNELLNRVPARNGINVRLDGPDGSRIVWVVNDPLDGDDWSSAQLNSIRRLLPHIRQAVRVQHALTGAGALGASLQKLLDTTGLGIVQLDGRGRIVAANDPARNVLRTGERMFDEDGFLHARAPEDEAVLQRLLARALPPFKARGVGGSTIICRTASLTPLVLHVNPVGLQETDLRVWPVAALVLLADTANRRRIEAGVVAETLGFTAMESRVAVLLAEGKTVREVAEATGRMESTIRSHVKHMFSKQGVSRQVDLVRLVLSLGSPPKSRR